MPSQGEQIWRIRDLLASPYPNAPSFHQLLRQVISDQTDIANKLNNTGRAWSTSEYTLNYNPNQSTYSINVTDFGKPLFVVRLIPNNPYIRAVPVPFSDAQEQNYGTLLTDFYNLYGAWFSVPSETIEQMAFSRTGIMNQEFKVSIQPQPAQACTYVITYLVGYFGSDNPLDAACAIPEFATLTQLRGAMAQLPYAQWFEDNTQNIERRKELSQAFAYQLERKEMDFDKYIRNLSHPRMVEVGWNDW